MYVTFSRFERAVALADDLAELPDPAAFAALVLPAVSALVGCDLATHNEVGPTPAQVRFTGYPPGLGNAQPPAFAAWVHQHPLVNHYRGTGDGRPVKFSDFLTRRDLHRLDLYAEFFAHVPTEHQIAFTLAPPSETVVGIALNRSRHDFDEADRDLLVVLRRVLASGLRRSQIRARADRALARSDSPRLAALTRCELDVLERVARGHTNAAIARSLDVSPRTVAKHLEHVYRKLDVTSRSAAVARAAGLDVCRAADGQPSHSSGPPGAGR